MAKEEFSQEDRTFILMSLDTQIGVLQRKLKAERNFEIARLIEADIAKVQLLSSKFRFSGAA